jgi:ABC-2 type transport system permease protein
LVGIGLAISALCQTQQQAILGAFATAVPIILISGFATPVENMPGWLQIVAMASPLKYFLIIVQGSFVKGMPATDVLANAWPMAVIAVVTLVMAVLIVRWKVR